MAGMEATEWRGHPMVDTNGDRIGDIEEIYVDIDTGVPEWALVNTGLFGTRSTFVPLQGATKDDGEVRVPHDRSRVKEAPSVEADQQLTREQEAELYRYYGLEYTDARSDTGLPQGGTGPGVEDLDAGVEDLDAGVGGVDAGFGGVDAGVGEVEAGVGAGGGRQPGPGRDVSGPETDDAMTRSEEEVDVSKTQHEAGRVRLRKYVVTEQVTKTVPVQREEVRLEREPITEENIGPATEGPAISEEEHEVVLHEEEVHVEKRTVPKERVRLDTETVTEEQQISEEVRKEQIEMEGDETTRRP